VAPSLIIISWTTAESLLPNLSCRKLDFPRHYIHCSCLPHHIKHLHGNANGVLHSVQEAHPLFCFRKEEFSQRTLIRFKSKIPGKWEPLPSLEELLFQNPPPEMLRPFLAEEPLVIPDYREGRL
jgi:hypothetical protein